jgi:hypothetical protein
MNKTATFDDQHDATGLGHAVDERREENSAMAGCPMASMCRGMLHGSGANGRFGLVLLAPGFLLLLLGIAVLVQPQVLVWIFGGLAVLLGSLLIGGGLWLHKQRMPG